MKIKDICHQSVGLIGSAIVENILEAVMSHELKVEFAYKKAHHGQVFYFHKLNLCDVVKGNRCYLSYVSKLLIFFLL
jgi:hypothetical protein